MKYDVWYNPSRKVWVVWRMYANGSAEVVKTFKTETGAHNWVKRQ